MPLDADISLTIVRALLGFFPRDRVFKARSIRSGALAFDAIRGYYMSHSLMILLSVIGSYDVSF